MEVPKSVPNRVPEKADFGQNEGLRPIGALILSVPGFYQFGIVILRLLQLPLKFGVPGPSAFEVIGFQTSPILAFFGPILRGSTEQALMEKDLKPFFD